MKAASASEWSGSYTVNIGRVTSCSAPDRFKQARVDL